MKLYTLNKYTLHSVEEFVTENENKDIVIEKALTESSKDDFTYRVETWESGEMIGEWRFFQNGKEFTDDIRRMLLGRFNGIE
jgi:hypothetical protein